MTDLADVPVATGVFLVLGLIWLGGWARRAWRAWRA